MLYVCRECVWGYHQALIAHIDLPTRGADHGGGHGILLQLAEQEDYLAGLCRRCPAGFQRYPEEFRSPLSSGVTLLSDGVPEPPPVGGAPGAPTAGVSPPPELARGKSPAEQLTPRNRPRARPRIEGNRRLSS